MKPWRLVRQFEDGRVEVECGRRRMRGYTNICVRCRRTDTKAFSTEPTGVANWNCDECIETLRAVEIAKKEAAARKRQAILVETGQTSKHRRVARLMLASPKWRDRGAILEIYDEAKRRAKQTGIEHDVDHIYPISSAFGCGLHVHWNLQILLASKNRSKGAGFPLHDSPAWDGLDVEEIERLWLEECRRFDKGRNVWHTLPLSQEI